MPAYQHRSGAPRRPAHKVRPVWLLAASAVAGVSGGIVVASQAIWAEAGPTMQALVATLLLSAAALLACLSPGSPREQDARPTLLTRDELAAAFARGGASPAVILCEVRDASGTVPAAQRLPALLPEGCLAAQWTAGRILVLLPDAADPVEVLGVARSLAAGIAEDAADGTAAAGLGAGIALAPRDGRQLDELAASAGLALAAARRQGTGHAFHAPGMAAEEDRRNTLLRTLRQAAGGAGLHLEFQPIFAMQSGELTGFEALLRLRHQELGAIAPAEFIPLAEQSGLIVDIGTWVVEEACRTAAQWPSHLVVAINLSPAQFHSGTLVATIRRALQRHALPAYRLEIEITEGTLMADSELVLSHLRMLRDMGVGVALDDFGAGYSSLSYLCRFPFSKLKIDRAFTTAMEQSGAARNVLQAIVKLGHGLGLAVTAEGIETERQLAQLREMGCDMAQGYLLGRPAPACDVAGIILRNFAERLVQRIDADAGRRPDPRRFALSSTASPV